MIDVAAFEFLVSRDPDGSIQVWWGRSSNTGLGERAYGAASKAQPAASLLALCAVGYGEDSTASTDSSLRVHYARYAASRAFLWRAGRLI